MANFHYFWRLVFIHVLNDHKTSISESQSQHFLISGKTIEALENRDSVRICRTKKEYMIEISKKRLRGKL